MHLFVSAFMTLFVDDTSVIQTGAFALALTSWFFIAWGLLYIFRGVLNLSLIPICDTAAGFTREV